MSEGQEELRSLGLDPLFPAQTGVAAKLEHLEACKRGCSQPMSSYNKSGKSCELWQFKGRRDMPTRFEGELLRYNRRVTRSGGDGLGLTSSCKSWLRHHLAMGPFCPIFSPQSFHSDFHSTLLHILCSIKDTHYQVHIGCDDLERIGSEHRNPEEYGTSLKTAALNTARRHTVSSLYVR